MAWTIFHHRSSYERGKCKGSVHLTLSLTTIFYRCQQTVQLPPVTKPIQLKQTTSPKTKKKMFQRKLYNNYVFCIVYCLLCIVCCVSQYCVVPTIKCKFFQQNLIVFSYKQKFILCKLLMFFFEWCTFLNVWMECSVDVTESLVEPLRFWSRYAVIPLAGLSRRSAGRWRP